MNFLRKLTLKEWWFITAFPMWLWGAWVVNRHFQWAAHWSGGDDTWMDVNGNIHPAHSFPLPVYLELPVDAVLGLIFVAPWALLWDVCVPWLVTVNQRAMPPTRKERQLQRLVELSEQTERKLGMSTEVVKRNDR